MPDPKPTVADRVDAMRTSLGHSEATPVTFERIPQDDGSVVVALAQANGGDRISARGANTEEAVSSLESRLAAWSR